MNESHICRLVFYWSVRIEKLVYKGDNHHGEPLFLLMFTSSRIDSIRTSQYLANLILKLVHRLRQSREHEPFIMNKDENRNALRCKLSSAYK